MRMLIGGMIVVVACGGSEPETPTPPAPQEETPTETETVETAVETPEPEVDPADSWVELLHALPGTWVSTSNAYRNEARQVGRLVDGDLESAWNSFSDSSTASIFVRVPEGATIRAIEMTAGYTKVSDETDLFTGNRRVTRVELRQGSNVLQSASLDPEVRELQRVVLDEPASGDLEIRLASYTPGTNTRWTELCVSELRVLGEASDAQVDQRQPMVHLGPLPPKDPAAHGQRLLDEVQAMVSSDDQMLDIGTSVRAFNGIFTRNRNVTLNAQLRAGSCYFIVGQSHQQVPEEVDYFPANIDVTVGEDSFVSDVEEPDPDFLVGYNREICPEETTRAEMVLSGDHMASYWLHIFARPDPDAHPEDGADLADDAMVESVTGQASDDGRADFMLTREGLHLTELTLGPSVENRQIEDPRATFSKADDDRVYCLTRLENPSREATTLYMGWERDDRPADPDDQGAWGRAMNIPAQPRYVTFGYRGTGQRPARYRCVIRDEDGVVLGRANYELTE